MDQKQADLVTVFAAYVASIPLFGLAYFLSYRRRRTNFVFASDVYSSRLSEEKRLADDQIGWLRLLLDYFEQLAIDYSDGAVREERSPGPVGVLAAPKRYTSGDLVGADRSNSVPSEA